jgi:hypothetical protein
MQTGIRIIKRGAQSGRSDRSANPVAKSDRERERDAVDSVKGWIADWNERKRSMQEAADSLLRSIGARRESSTNRFAF